jgi:hypothetical protein
VRSDYEFEQKLKQLEYDEKYKKRFVNSLVDVPPMHVFEPRLIFDSTGNARDKDPNKTEVSCTLYLLRHPLSSSAPPGFADPTPSTEISEAGKPLDRCREMHLHRQVPAVPKRLPKGTLIR